MTISFAPAAPAHLATISLAALCSDDASVSSTEIGRLRKVCETVGFFYLSEHGISRKLIDRITSSSRCFFKKPLQYKEKYGQDKQVFYPQSLRGYARMGVEHFNPDQETDIKETFEFGPRRRFCEGVPFTGETVSPPDHEISDFTESNMELLEIVRTSLVPKIGRALALSLDLEENFFNKHLKEDKVLITQRVAYYPAGKSGCGRHSDTDLFTVLVQEEQTGDITSLKVYSNGRWANVKSNPDLVIINLGNMLQHWTNRRFVSTPHQVVHEADTDRISIPVFVYPHADTKIKPIGHTENGDSTITVGETYINDLLDIWERKAGVGKWKNECLGRKNKCHCWKCE